MRPDQAIFMGSATLSGVFAMWATALTDPIRLGIPAVAFGLIAIAWKPI